MLTGYFGQAIIDEFLLNYVDSMDSDTEFTILGQFLDSHMKSDTLF